MSKFVLVLLALMIKMKAIYSQNLVETTTNIIGVPTINESTNISDTTTGITIQSTNTTSTTIIENVSTSTTISTSNNSTTVPTSTTSIINSTSTISSTSVTPFIVSNTSQILENVTNTIKEEISTTNDSNITMFFLNATTIEGLISPTFEEDCNQLCESRKKNIILAVSLSVFGGLVLIGIFAYMGLYKRKNRIRYGYGTVSKQSGYTPVPPSNDDYMEPIPVPKTIGVEKV